MDDLLVLDPGQTAKLLTLERAVAAVEEVYRALAAGEARLFPFVRERLGANAVCGVKSGYWSSRDVVGLKLAGYWPGNGGRGLANHQASVLLAEASTGRLLAVMDGNVVTSRRTAAAGVVAARLLGRPRPAILAILGAGSQGRAQAEALRRFFPSLRELRIWDRRPARAEALARRLAGAAGGPGVVAVPDVAGAVLGADLVVTATASDAPLLEGRHLSPGAHVNAMGSDTAGKRELEPRLVETCRLVVDDRSQSRLLGESQPPVRWDQEPATIGEVFLGLREGRTSDEELTVFDSTGLGLQDVAAAEIVYREALRLGHGLVVPWRPLTAD